MRFKMRSEAEDERRYSGVVTGVSDADPVRWPGSKWRCLSVRWDDLEISRPNKVSPWEIEATGTVSVANSLSTSGMKRPRGGLPLMKPDFPVPRDGAGSADFGESSRFQKVLQGQEVFRSPCDGIDAYNNLHASDMRRLSPSSFTSGISGLGNGLRNMYGDSAVPYNNTGFGESLRFQKVLQGQETYSHFPRGSGYIPPLLPSTPSIQASSPSSVLMFPQVRTVNPAPYFHNAYEFNHEYARNHQSPLDVPRTYNDISSSMGDQKGIIDNQQGVPFFRGTHGLTDHSCRLFGFSLREGNTGIPKDCNLTKVGDNLNPKLPLVTNIVGSSCTKGRDMYAVRDMLLDIAL